MSLQPGSLDAFGDFVDVDCMARYMEDALPKPAVDGDPGRAGRRQFLIAIATGVIEYLRAHQSDGFIVRAPTTTDVVGRLEIR
jgi:hypothetical protein